MSSVHRLASLLILLAVWALVSLVFPPSVVPGIPMVAEAIWANIISGEAVFHVSKTLLRVGGGLILTMVLGLAVGTAMGLSRKAELYLDAWVMTALAVPAIVYGILSLLWLGLNDVAAIAAIGTAAFPPVAISIWKGIKGIDLGLITMGRAFRLPPAAIVFKIVFPLLLSDLLAAARYALGICWKIATIVELIGMSSGVGYMLHYSFGLFSMTQVFAWTVLFLVVMFLIEFLAFKPVERRLTRWRPDVTLPLGA
jgi:NitT/TauT family transport system permease protein